MISLVPSVHADDLPVSYTQSGTHLGVWVDGVITNNNPTELSVDRAGGVSNVLDWVAPANDGDGTLSGYVVYRATGDGPLDAVATYNIGGATTTQFTDPDASFTGTYAYWVEAVYTTPSTQIETHSLPSSAIVVNPFVYDEFGYPHCSPYWINFAAVPPIGVLVACITP